MGWLLDPNNLTAISTVVIAIFTVVLAIVGGRQAQLTRQAIELARDEFNATHRPHIIVLSLDTVYDGEEPDDRGSVMVRAGALLRFVNAGKGTATTTEIGVTISRDSPRPDTIFGILETKGVELTSGEEGTHWIESALLRVEGGAFDRTFGRPLYCAGYIRYKDAAGRHRKTAFCRRLHSLSGDWVTVENSPYEYSY